MTVDRRCVDARAAVPEALVDWLTDAPVASAVVRGQPLVHEWVNDAYAALLGRTAEDLLGRSMLDVLGDGSLAALAVLLQEARAAQGRRTELAFTRRDGEVLTLSAALSAAPSGVPGHWLMQVDNLTDERRSAATLRHHATHDVVTGLPNRALFADHLEHALHRLSRHPERHAAVLFLDLDRLKHINDTYGHAAGDQLLAAFAERLSHAVRPQDVVARHGGDEFTVLLEDLEDPAAANAIAQRCLHAAAEPIDVGGDQMRVTVSIGIALADASSSGADVLAAADSAMYRAKETGRNRARFAHQEGLRHLSPRAALERQLAGALDRGQLEVHYQPVIDLTTGTVSAGEALLRWRHPEHGLLSAAEFIDIAANAGLLSDIGRWVCETTTAELHQWDLQGVHVEQLYLNIAGEQLLDGTLTEHIARCLRENKLDASRLCLEITETEISSSSGTLRQLHALHELGCQLAIDDFGTGYSSLSRLVDLPVDAVKIDKSFIAGVGSDPRPTAIVSATLLLAHDLHQVSIAEGVETEAQHRWLLEAGCTHAQGYLLSRPVPADEFIDLVRLAATTSPRLPGREFAAAGSQLVLP